MRKAIWILFIVILVGGGYKYFYGKDFVVRFSEAQIQERLASKLPLTKRYLVLIELTLSNPRVELENGSNRLKAGLDAALNGRINNSQIPLSGTIDISGSLSYVAENGDFFLVNPTVHNLIIHGMPEKYQDKINELAAKAIAEHFESNPIYTLKKTDLQQAAARAVIKNIIIENKELVVTLGVGN